LVFPARACCIAHGAALSALVVFERDGLARIFREQFRRFGTAGLELACCSQAQSLHLFGFQFAELAGLYIENQGAVADTANLLDVVADLLEHLAQFAIAALDDDDFVPGVVAFAHLADAGRGRTNFVMFFRAAALDGNAFAESVESLFGWLAGNFDEIGLFDAGSSLGELIREIAVVGDHEQAFAQVVETANRIEALGSLREELHHGGTAFRVSHGGDEAAGLIEHEVAQALGALQQLAIDADVIASSVCLGTQRGDDLAVDLDASSGDHLFRMTATGDAGLGEDLLQALELGRGGFTRRERAFGRRSLFLFRNASVGFPFSRRFGSRQFGGLTVCVFKAMRGRGFSRVELLGKKVGGVGFDFLLWSVGRMLVFISHGSQPQLRVHSPALSRLVRRGK
jgi:hypothetical protein